MNYVEREELFDMMNIDYNNLNDINQLRYHINIWREEYMKLNFLYRRLKEYVANETIKMKNINDENNNEIKMLKDKIFHYEYILNKLKNHKLTLNERIKGKINLNKWIQ